MRRQFLPELKLRGFPGYCNRDHIVSRRMVSLVVIELRPGHFGVALEAVVSHILSGERNGEG